jgi:purine nucleoside phosphorylase
MGDLSEKYTFEEIETIAKYLKNKIKIVPKVGIICGSGLGKLFFFNPKMLLHTYTSFIYL